MRVITATLILLAAIPGGALAETQTAANASKWMAFYNRDKS